MKRNKTARFFITLLIILAILASLGVGGFFLLDKVVVPKYFGSFGINNMQDLTQMMGTLYTSKNESKFITNPYTAADLSSAENKLKLVGFPTLETGRLDYKAIAEGSYIVESDAEVKLTDKELASVLNGMLASGILSEKLPNLKYINTLNMELLEIIITPFKIVNNIDPNSAKIELAIKIDTTSLKNQIADEMQTPLFLLNMIIPKTLYINLNFDLTANGENWEYTNSSIRINGKTSQQSEILMNLLIKFIFPEEDEMTMDKLNTELGGVLIEGVDLLGSIRFSNEIYSTKQNGVVITLK
ncbi:MAG: hypothetical protein IJT25_00625 [Clostridia bacterium]|nr:hypothetical protein [Clostridia bacterium]